MPIASPWPSTVLSRAHEQLQEGRSFNDVVTYLVSANPTVSIESAQIAVATILNYHWSRVRSELVGEYKHSPHVTWAHIASLTGFATPVAANRHFSRMDESDLVHVPSAVRARRAKNLIPNDQEL